MRSSRTAFRVYLLPTVALVLIQIHTSQFWSFHKRLLSEGAIDASLSIIDQPHQAPKKLSLSDDIDFPPLPILPQNQTFGACLMVKGDNDLLSEWIPYHYTLLPLRYLLVVTDVGNSEGPESVLKKWTSTRTGLHWWVKSVSEIENLHGEFQSEQVEYQVERRHGRTGPNVTIDSKKAQYVAHSHLVHKQKAMITYCTKFMKQRGVRWLSMYDTDEFLAINRMGTAEQNGLTNKTSTFERRGETYGMRPQLPPIESNATVAEIIYSFETTQQPLKSCHTMPRVSFGAIENFTCPGSEDIKAFAKENFDFNRLGTLRYQQHAIKTDFSKNRFGKVFIDVSSVSDHTLSIPPKNIHRPYADECIRPIVPVQEAPFYLMHYAGGWERFKSKNDKRRGFEQWKELADVSDSTSCCQQEVYRWLPRFVDQVGISRARFLLSHKTIG